MTTSDIKPRKVIVVMPAYNASKTLKMTYDAIPDGAADQVILVDDGSKDNTVEVAKELGLTVFLHAGNFGYGANQKTCYQEALNANATIVVMVHPDYQYDPTLVPEIIKPIEDGEYDIVFGSRMAGESAYRQGMPWWKYIANIFLTKVENVTFDLNMSEYHTGYRAFRAEVLESVNFDVNSDAFIFDQEIVAQAVACGFRIGEISVPVRYFPEASSASFIASSWYGLGILRLCAHYMLHKTGIRSSTRYICHQQRYNEVS